MRYRAKTQIHTSPKWSIAPSRTFTKHKIQNTKHMLSSQSFKHSKHMKSETNTDHDRFIYLQSHIIIKIDTNIDDGFNELLIRPSSVYRLKQHETKYTQWNEHSLLLFSLSLSFLLFLFLPLSFALSFPFTFIFPLFVTCSLEIATIFEYFIGFDRNCKNRPRVVISFVPSCASSILYLCSR